MKVTLDREGKNIVKLDLELEPEKAIKAYETTCRRLSHQVSVPGFRRGKVPRNIMEKRLGIDYIKNEALKGLVNEMLDQAISSEKLDLITLPKIDSLSFELGEPLRLKALCEVRPEVMLGEYKGIEVNVVSITLPADALDKALASLAQSRMSFETIAPRPLVLGDTVLLNFECLVNDKVVEGGKANGLVLEVKEGGFLPGFCEQLIGHEPKEKFDVKVKFPDEYRNKELSGKDAVFTVELCELRAKAIPAIDDKLAQALGHESLDKLKETLKEHLDAEIEQENELRAQRAVVDKVVSSAQVDIPESMIEREANQLLAQVKAYFKEKNRNWEEFEQSQDYEKMCQEQLKEARRRVNTSLVLGAVIHAENMSVEDEDVAGYLKETGIDLSDEEAQPETRWRAMEEVLTHKVVELLVKTAKITYVPQEPTPEPAKDMSSSKTEASTAIQKPGDELSETD